MFTTEDVVDKKPWYFDIKHFLQTQEYSAGASNKDRKTLRRLVDRFFLKEHVLYKRNYDTVLLRCVDKHEADMLMHEIHEGSFGTHANGHSMAKKMLRVGYYWLKMDLTVIKLQRSSISVRFTPTKFMFLRHFSMLFLPRGISLCGVLT